MTRSAEAAKGLYVKQKEQGLPFIVPNNSIGMNQLNEEVRFGLMPLGTVFAVAANITGAFVPPATGVIKDGFMVCDGAAIPSVAFLQGNTPDLTDNRFLMGASVAGTTGGNSNNQVTLTSTQLPSHTHPVGTYSTNTVNAPHSHGDTFAIGTVNAPHSHGDTFAVGTASAPHSHSAPGSNAFYVRSPGAGLAMDLANSPQHTANANTSTDPANAPHSHPLTGSVSSANAPHSHTISGSSGSAGSGNAFDVRPLFLSTVYLIRVK